MVSRVREALPLWAKALIFIITYKLVVAGRDFEALPLAAKALILSDTWITGYPWDFVGRFC